MRPAAEARPEFVAAFAELAGRIAASLVTVAPPLRPIRMIVAGGAAMHLYTGARVSRDVDAVFSHRIALPQDLRIAYRDADGKAQTLYFDYQYNDSLALMHEQAHDDAVALSLPNIDAGLLDIRLLAPLDLAVSKLARFAAVDRGDIAELARARLINAAALRQRATEALAGYVGDLVRVRRSIEMACNLVEDCERRVAE
jgi:hypothetical protein